MQNTNQPVQPDTVITWLQMLEWREAHPELAKKLSYQDSLAPAQDAHTKQELIKQGWKSPEEVQEIRTQEAKWLEDIGEDLLCNACGEEDCGYGQCDLLDTLKARIAELIKPSGEAQTQTGAEKKS